MSAYDDIPISGGSVYDDIPVVKAKKRGGSEPVVRRATVIEPSAAEFETASRYPVMVRNRAGAPVFLPNTPEPAPDAPSANWTGEGGVLQSLLPGARLALSEAVGRVRQMFNTGAAQDRARTIEQAGNNPLGFRIPSNAITRQAQKAAADRAAAEEAAMIASGAQAERQAITPKNMSTAQQAVSSVAQSAAPTLAGVAAGIATRSPTLAMSIAGLGGGAQAGGATYGEALEKGATHDQAARAAGIDAVLEGVGEALPLKFALKPGTAIFKRIFGTMAAEAGQEGATQAMQDLHASLTFNPEITLQEALQNLKVATLAGGIGGGVYGGAGAIAEAGQRRAATAPGRALGEALEADIAATEADPNAILAAARQALNPASAQRRAVRSETPMQQPIRPRGELELPPTDILDAVQDQLARIREQDERRAPLPAIDVPGAETPVYPPIDLSLLDPRRPAPVIEAAPEPALPTIDVAPEDELLAAVRNQLAAIRESEDAARPLPEVPRDVALPKRLPKIDLSLINTAAPEPKVEPKPAPRRPVQDEFLAAPEAPDEPTKPKGRNLLREVRQWGGVKTTEARTIAGERGFRANIGAGGLFRKKGLGIDEIATYMHERGWLTDDEYNDVDGGVEAARAKLQAAIAKEDVIHPQDLEKFGEYERAVREYEAEIRDHELRPADAPDLSMVERANVIDPDAVERAAVQYDGDDDGFIRAIQEIIDGSEQSAQTGERRETGAGTAQQAKSAYEDIPITQKAARSQTGEAGLPEDLALTGQTETEIQRERATREREQAQARRKQGAPSPEDFTLTGSDRDVDLAEARGQGSLYALNAAGQSALSNVPRVAQFGTERASLNDAIADAQQLLGFGIDVETEHAPLPLDIAGRFDPQERRITLNSSIALTRSDAALAMAEEILHAVDNVGPRRQLSAASPRLALRFEGSEVVPQGDLATEAVAAMKADPRIYDWLRYPVLTKELTASRIKAELFARVGVLYSASPEFVRRAMPKSYEAYHDLFGSHARSAVSRTGQVSKQIPRRDSESAGRNENAGDVRPSGRPETGARGGDRGGGTSQYRDHARLHREIVRIWRSPPLGGLVQGNLEAVSSAPPPGGSARAGLSQGPYWNVDQPTLVQNILRTFQSSAIDIHKVQDAIEQAAGTIPDSKSPRLVEEVFKGRVRTKVVRFHKNMVEPMLKAMAAAKITPEQLGDYLWARHAPERNAQMLRVNPGGPGNLSGMSDAEAAQKLAAIPAGQRAEYKRIAAMVDRITAATRSIIVNEGLEDPATVRAWQNAYKNYVPLFRDVDDPVSGAGFVVKGPESQRAMGSQKEAIAILAAVISQHEAAILRAEKATVGRTLIDMAEANPNPDFWKVDQPPTKRIINKSTGLVQTMVDPLYKNREDVYVVKDRVNGKVVERVLAFNPNNERAMRVSKALRKLDVVEFGAVTATVAKVTRIMANLATTWNPAFWTTNFVRDVQTVAVNLQATPIQGRSARVIASIPKAIAGILSAEFRNGTGTWAKLYRQFEDEGGKMGWMSIFDDLRDRQKEIGKEIARSQQSNADPRKWGRIALETVEQVNSAIENATRLAVFAEALKAGQSPKRAASIAKNASVNFDRKGNVSSVMGAWYMFFNAQAQGTAIMLKSIAKSRRVQLMVGAMVAFSAAVELINRMIGDADRDEEGNNPYELIEEHIRQKNMIFMLPGSAADGKPNYVSLPLPYGFSMFHNAGRMVMETALRSSKLVDEKSPIVNTAWRFAEVLLDNFGPLGGSSTPLQYFAPTVAKPVVQAAENRTWFGAPIHPEPQLFGRAAPKSEQYFRSTSDTAKELAAFLSRLTGGDDIAGGAIDIYPGNIEHIFATAGGGTGRFAVGMLDFTKHVVGRVTGEVTADDLPAKAVPFVGKFYGEVDERAQAAKYYRLIKEAQTVYKQYTAYKKAGERDKADALEEKHPELIEMARVAVSKRHRADMRMLREEFKEVNELPITERGKARNNLRKEEATIMGEALRAYNEVIADQRESNRSIANR